MFDLTLTCPVCDRRADVCFDHGDDWKRRERATVRAARKARETHTGTIQLVDYRDRTVATLPLRGNAERELYAALARWRKFDAVGGYARDETGSILAYC